MPGLHIIKLKTGERFVGIEYRENTILLGWKCGRIESPHFFIRKDSLDHVKDVATAAKHSIHLHNEEANAEKRFPRNHPELNP